MRILDLDSNKPCRYVGIMLTPEEAKELTDLLKAILDDPKHEGHLHVSDAEYRREITVAIYTEKNLGQFSKEVQRLIEQDE